MEERVKERLAALVGQSCWGAIAGAGDDYSFVLHFGERLRRSLRLANPQLSFLQRTYEGTYALVVQCAWRVDAPDDIVASCWDEAEVRETGLQSLVQRKVVEVVTRRPGYDLEVVFDGEYALRGLSVQTDARRGRDDWRLYGPQGYVRVGPGARPEVRTAEEAQAEFARTLKVFAGDEPGLPVRIDPTRKPPRPELPPVPSPTAPRPEVGAPAPLPGLARDHRPARRGPVEPRGPTVVPPLDDESADSPPATPRPRPDLRPVDDLD